MLYQFRPCGAVFCFGEKDMQLRPELVYTVTEGNALLLNFIFRHPCGNRLSQVTK